jgi:hypothetical protein
MRAAGVVVGLEPGLGKSIMLGYITDTLASLGYVSEPISDTLGRFGWGEVADADLAYMDDLTRENQGKLLAHPKLKTLVTGGKMGTERKGQDGVQTASKATVIVFTNCYEKKHFYGMDEGSIDRFNFLSTYGEEDLKKVHTPHDGRTLFQYRRLADKYNVSTETLTAYLLARSAEYFLETIGMEFKNEQLLKIEGQECKLEETFETLQQQYVYKPFVSHTKLLVDNIAHMCALAIRKVQITAPKQAEALTLAYEASDFSLNLMTVNLLHFSHSSTNEKYDLQNVKHECKEAISKHDIGSEVSSKNIKSAFESIARELLTKDGFSYPITMTMYNTDWVQARKRIRGYVKEYQSFDWEEAKKPLNDCVSALTTVNN